MPIRPRILIVGDDVRQLYTWEMMLGIQFSVSMSARLSEALKVLGEQRFELIIIFNASDNWKRLVGFSSRQIPAAKVLVVTTDENEWPDWADEVMCRYRTPNDLIEKCGEIFGMPRKSKARGFTARSSGKVVPIS
ncbi:MAG: hypothetical protein JST28_22270 [Acidobacteria bacterium]|nr:hypothetical protein [Acidobacteriota bacterium]